MNARIPEGHHFPVVVIGAGQAGLVAASELRRRGLQVGTDFVVIDSQWGPGGAWRDRWPSLTMARVHGIDDLPGLAMRDVVTVAPTAHASEAVSQYFSAYEAENRLDVLRPYRVAAVYRHGRGPFSLRVESLAATTHNSILITCDVIINATGTWNRPFIPAIPGLDKFQGRQLHTRDFGRAIDFSGERVLVVGGGLSAVQMLLEIAPFAGTVWSTRRPPAFRREPHVGEWGRAVEARARLRMEKGLPTRSIVSNTGIPPLADYVKGIDDGILVSRGPVVRFGSSTAIFGGPGEFDGELAAPVFPRSWRPFAEGTRVTIDTIFWNTGFRHDLGHLRSLRMREHGGGIRIVGEVAVVRQPGLYLVGYGSTASTRGAIRGGRAAAREAVQYLTAHRIAL